MLEAVALVSFMLAAWKKPNIVTPGLNRLTVFHYCEKVTVFIYLLLSFKVLHCFNPNSKFSQNSIKTKDNVFSGFRLFFYLESG